MKVTSTQGDTVDEICHRHYGYTSGVTEQVLSSNLGLAEYGAILPAGVEITLPQQPTQQTVKTIKLWD